MGKLNVENVITKASSLILRICY